MRTVIAVAAMLLVRACILTLYVYINMSYARYPKLPCETAPLSPPRSLPPPPWSSCGPGPRRTSWRRFRDSPGTSRGCTSGVQRLTRQESRLYYNNFYPPVWISFSFLVSKIMILGVSLSVTANFDTLRQKLLWNLQNNPSRQVQWAWKYRSERTIFKNFGGSSNQLRINGWTIPITSYLNLWNWIIILRLLASN